jgi:hypothetical protein
MIRLEQNKVLELETLNIQRVARVRDIMNTSREKGTVPTNWELSENIE